MDDVLIDPVIAKDMMLMLGWEDNPNIIIKDFTESEHTLINHSIANFYEAYAGNDFILLTVSKNRNLSIFVKNDLSDDKLFNDADYIMRTYHFSSILTELEIESINLTATRYSGDDFITITWSIDNSDYRFHVWLDL